MPAYRPDIAILGGGLAGGLIALALAGRRPELDLLLIEQGESLGGNHVWSFFASDIAPDHRWLVERLTLREWPTYDVAFPAHARRLTTGYASITSDRFADKLRKTLPPRAILTGARIASCGPDHAVLADGSRIEAGAVIDARGVRLGGELAGGWQKFLGLRLALREPHGLDQPVVMDARVEQIDGFRFVYVLPFTEREVFVEDTYYSNAPQLDRAALRARIGAYARARGWTQARSLGEETGVLPVVTGGSFAAFWGATGQGVAKAGTRAGLFHPLTSYSLPDAVRFAALLAEQRDLSGAALARFSEDHARAHWRRGRFARRLGAMLLGAAAPDQRYRVLQRFYRLPQPTIERFYAGRLTIPDRLRILSGRPPVPLGRALATLTGLRPRADGLRLDPQAAGGQ
jgi:lycopene beta-cyclase